MDELVKQVNNLYEYVGQIKRAFDDSNSNMVKVLAYLLNKSKELDDDLKTVNSIITDLKVKSTVNESDISSIENRLTEIENSNSVTNEEIGNVAKDLDACKEDISKKIDDTNNAINDIKNSSIKTTDYVIIAKEDNFFKKSYKIRQKIYDVIHWRKIRNAQMEQARILAEIEEENKRKLIEEERQKLIEKEIKKQEALNEIQNILKKSKK